MVVGCKQRRWFLGRCAMGVKDDDELVVVDAEKKRERGEQKKRETGMQQQRLGKRQQDR